MKSLERVGGGVAWRVGNPRSPAAKVETGEAMKRKAAWKQGDCVRVKLGPKRRSGPRKIEWFISDYGVVLDKTVDGFTCWNVDDLVRFRHKGRKHAR